MISKVHNKPVPERNLQCMSENTPTDKSKRWDNKVSSSQDPAACAFHSSMDQWVGKHVPPHPTKFIHVIPDTSFMGNKIWSQHVKNHLIKVLIGHKVDCQIFLPLKIQNLQDNIC
jgi:hypothetical protein